MTFIYMVKMESDVVVPSKPIFYHRFVDNIYSRRKLGDNALFDQLKCHPNIKLTIDVNSSMFLDTKLTNINATINGSFYSGHKITVVIWPVGLSKDLSTLDV